MKFLSLEPFVPSGSNFEGSKFFFQELGFTVKWADSDYVGFESDGCKFVLQKFENKEFAQNYMVTVRINNAKEFWTVVTEKQLLENLVLELAHLPNNLMASRLVLLTSLASVGTLLSEHTEGAFYL
jgi:hypothetical protein